MKSAQCLMLSGILGLSLVGCGQEPAPTAPVNTASAVVELPQGIRLSTTPDNVKNVADVRSAGLKDGDRVVVHGLIGGRAEPMAANRAILTLLDTSIKTCDQNPGDGCTTPWDACCEPADVKAKNSITIQVVDAQGQPLATSLAALEGVKPMARITVDGIAKTTPDGVVLINAKGIYVAR